MLPNMCSVDTKEAVVGRTTLLISWASGIGFVEMSVLSDFPAVNTG